MNKQKPTSEGWSERFHKKWLDKFGISEASLYIKVGDNSNFSYGTFYTFFKSFIREEIKKAKREEKWRIKKAILLIDDLDEAKEIIRKELEEK